VGDIGARRPGLGAWRPDALHRGVQQSDDPHARIHTTLALAATGEFVELIAADNGREIGS